MKFIKPLTETELTTLQDMHRHHASRRARLRAHCLLLSHDGYKLKEIAQVYQVDYRRVSVWMDRWHTCGLVGLYDQPRGGRPPIYNPQEQERVEHYLQLYPQNVKRIVEEMSQETHKKISAKTMKRYIKKKGKSGNGLRRHPRNRLIPTSTDGVKS